MQDDDRTESVHCDGGGRGKRRLVSSMSSMAKGLAYVLWCGRRDSEAGRPLLPLAS